MSLFNKLFSRGKKSRPQAAAAAKKPIVAATPPPVDDTLSPEELCGITATMPADEIRKQLAKMFRRYNSLTSSLDPASRAEAEQMLDVIVQMRKTYL